MGKLEVPAVFGWRPILMMGYDGRLRIIYPDGRVEYADWKRETFEYGCTTRSTQEEAYRAAVDRDASYAAMGMNPERFGDQNFSAFLGYL